MFQSLYIEHPNELMRYFFRGGDRVGIPPALRLKWFGTVAAVVLALALFLGGLIYSAARHGGAADGWVPANARTEQKPQPR